MAIIAALAAFNASAGVDRALRDAVSLSQYDMPAELPTIRIVADDVIDRYVPPRAGKSAWGFYYHMTRTVYLSDRLGDSVRSQSWRIHEMVHYLQDLAGKSFTTCYDRRELEREAYVIQNKWLAMHDKLPIDVQVSAHTCR